MARHPFTGDSLRRASTAILGLGLVFLSVTNVFLSEKVLWVRLVESGLPIGLSLIFLAFGVSLWERGMSPDAMVVITGWGLAGSIVTGALAVWLLAVVTLQGDPITDPTYVIASSSTVGATFGGAAGFYHAELQQSTAELRRQNVRLDEFASIVSHDLRNPLAVADGGLGLARETGDDEDFDRVEKAHDRMDRMITELLILAREGRDVTDLEPVAIRSVAERATGTVAGSIEVDLNIERDVHADPDRLAALFENLFRNSAEHAGPGSTVTVGGLQDNRGFYVADDGPGIPPEDRQEVFQHGYTTNQGGTGLGLSIVRRIADAHGWSVNLTESETGGARFEFRI